MFDQLCLPRSETMLEAQLDDSVCSYNAIAINSIECFCPLESQAAHEMCYMVPAQTQQSSLYKHINKLVIGSAHALGSSRRMCRNGGQHMSATRMQREECQSRAACTLGLEQLNDFNTASVALYHTC